MYWFVSSSPEPGLQKKLRLCAPCGKCYFNGRRMARDGPASPLYIMVDEYFAILGAELPDVFSSFDAEIELCMGPEEEKHIITKPTFVFIPKGFYHCPLNFKNINKPVLFQAIHLGLYFHEINGGQWVYFMGPGKSMAGFGPPPKKSQ